MRALWLAMALSATPLLAAAQTAAPDAAPAASASPAPTGVAAATPNTSGAAASSTTAAPAAAAATPPAAPAAPAKFKLDSGDTAWMLTSTALVLMMTIPGLALFYGGMVRKKNVIATVAQSFAMTAVVTVVWYILTYSIAFGTLPDASQNKWWGGLGNFMLKNIQMDGMDPKVPTVAYSIAGTNYTIPEYVYMMFQMTFAIITPALIAGAFAERLKFSALLILTVLWSIFVYAPIAHWVWGGGFLGAMGVMDFAGGTVVHINAGIAGLICALVLPKRKGLGSINMAPNNLVYTMIGASLLWVGWFGFNAGSAVAANALAGIAMANTQIATAAAALAWMVVEWVHRKKPTMLGLASGAVAGLVAVTPASGWVLPNGALWIGIAAGAGCYCSSVFLKGWLKYDDSLDCFGVHGVGGFIGAMLTGVFASATVATLPAGHGVMTQLISCLATMAWTAVGTFIILMIIKFTVGLTVTEDQEHEGLDLALHGEAIHD
jgi:Amt family ammonium transporter